MKLHGLAFCINGIYYFIPWYNRTESNYYVASRVAEKLQHIYPGLTPEDVLRSMSYCTCTAIYRNNETMLFNLIGDMLEEYDLSLYDDFMILEV